MLDKLEPLPNGPFIIVKNLKEVIEELSTQKGKTIHIHRNHLIANIPKNSLLFPHIESYNEQASVRIHAVDISESDVIRILYILPLTTLMYMTMSLMLIHSVMTMITHQLRLIKNYTNP